MVQRAQTIADLLPCEDHAVAYETATELITTKGRGVLWIIDGWDELPLCLQQDSIFCRFIQPCYPDKTTENYRRRLLTESSVIVTSHPISSGNLYKTVSSRIVVLGFTPKEQRQYFNECLKGDTQALESLLEAIQENPVIQSSCYHPLHAAFVVDIFKFKAHSLPNTEYEIFAAVILNCILRHFQREKRDHGLPTETKSLDDLSRCEVTKVPFLCLSELAYRGVMENKVTFSSNELSSNTFSLLQGVESFLQNGRLIYYNFLCLSFQEVLAAYYIANLPDSKQASQFQRFFYQPRFSAVFHFYAAITKLRTPRIRKVIVKIVKEESKPLLISLLHCLYEAQDPSLCHYLAEQLEQKLDLSRSSLSLLDCLSISYFLANVTNSASDYNEFVIDLSECFIDSQGIKCLTRSLCSDSQTTTVTHLNMKLQNNMINEESVAYIAKMLNTHDVINNLALLHNPIGDSGISYLSECVKKSAALKTLNVFDCGLTSKGAEELSNAIALSNSLEKLDVGGNELGDQGIGHVAEALTKNKQLKELWISDCEITDIGVTSLANALSANNSLKLLHMGSLLDCKITQDGLSVLIQTLSQNSGLMKMRLPFQLDFAADKLEQSINERREKNGVPPIEVEGAPVDTTYSREVFDQILNMHI